MGHSPLLTPGTGGHALSLPEIGWKGPPPSARPVRQYEPPPEGDWQRYGAAVARHKWLVLALTVLGTAIGVVLSHYVEPEYATTSVLWVEANEPRGDGAGIAGGGIRGPEAWVELVKSRAVLADVVDRLRLYLHPRSANDAAALADFQFREGGRAGSYRLVVDVAGGYQLERDAEGIVDRGRIGDSVGTELGFLWAPMATELPPDGLVEFTVASPYQTAQALIQDLHVEADLEGTFLRVEVRGVDAERSAATAAAIADRVVAVAADLKRRRVEELATILGGQYEHAQRSLGEAEATLTSFRTRTATRLRDHTPVVTPNVDARGDPAFSRAFDLQLTLEQVRHDRREITEALQATPASGLRIEALTAIGAVRESPQLSHVLEEITRKEAELRALRSRYTEASAPSQKLQAELDTLRRRTVANMAREVVSGLDARAALLEPMVDSAFRYLREVPALALQEARFERDVAGAEELFSHIRRRYESARLEMVSSLPDLRILDRAVVPQRPVINLRPVVIGLSVLTSFGLAVLGVTLVDRTDRKVRYPAQIIDRMHLPILGAVPNWRRTRGASGGEVELIEALRGLRLRILSAHGVDGPLLVTISSPAPGDGKSFVAVNLALSFAYAGYRTLLIDGDVRGGMQHRVLNTSRRPGLTDVLAGQATDEAAIRKTDFAGLLLLRSGTRLHRAPELLLSKELQSLLARMAAQYNVIIVDSPPLSAGVDPLALASVTGNLLMVLRPGATDLALAMSKLDALDAFPVRTMGVVLNDVRGGDAFQYYTYDLSAYPESDEQLTTSRDWPGILGGRS